MSKNITETKIKEENQNCVCGNLKTHDELACSDCSEDLFYEIRQRMLPSGMVATMSGEITFERFWKSLTNNGIGPGGQCCFCGRNYIWHGHNPRPAAIDGRCCAECNDNTVRPARRKAM